MGSLDGGSKILKVAAKMDDPVPDTNDDLTADYRRKLQELTPTFQENLIRAFRNEAVRTQRRKHLVKSVHKLDPVLLSLDNNKIELSDLKLLWLPDFRIANLTVDLPNLCLDMDLKLGNLRIEGVYDVNNLMLQKFLPVSHNGKVVVTFSDVTTKGRVGLHIQGDSFVPANYDLAYQWTATEVNYYVSNETQIENAITSSGGEQTLGDTIWLQLNDLLTSLLDEQLAGVVVGFSVTESLADEDQDLRKWAQQAASKANRVFDTLLCSAKDYLVAKNYWAIETPPFDVVYRGKPASLDQGIFQTGKGYLQDLSSLSRLQDLSLYETEQQAVVYGSLKLRDFKHGYEIFSSKFEGTEVSGSIRTSVYKNGIFIKLSCDKTDLAPVKLEAVSVRTIGDVDVDASGLASLSWLVPKVTSWTVGNLRCKAVPVLEKHIVEAFNYAIEARQSRKSASADEDSAMFWKGMFVAH
ncbi:uncharacterized protein LOC132699021 isoform X2 [Cylas formicarius]|uniref:uncharacterized protein LOC132699021 isoform X2 n=1 Tax=Cylas formicarius TaxID=197179 RepID=UPI00295899BE|nr:uncharacterized protein LOC132699021 isoform X2 [Cylas formicarius]